MCGGAIRDSKGFEDSDMFRILGIPNGSSQADQTYTPPDLKALYATFKESGRVPYSYYGAGSPTREGEAELVRKSYPGAYSSTSAPAPTPNPQTSRQSDPRDDLLRRMGPLGALLGGLARYGGKSGG